MAPLTWREVSAPSFSGSSGGGAAAAVQAANLINQGFGGLSTALERFQEGRQQQADQAFLAQMAGMTDANTLESNLRAGVPTSVSPEALKFGMQHSQHLLRNDGIRAQNQGLNLANERASWNFGNEQAFEAARPAALERVNQIRSLALQGTPESIEQANRLMAESSDVFAAAGFTPEGVGNLINGNASTSATGMAQQNAFQAIADNNLNREQADEARALFADVYRSARNPEEAAAMIRSNPEITPEVAGMTLGFIEQEGANLFGPAPSPQDVLWNQALQERQQGGQQGGQQGNQQPGAPQASRIEYANTGPRTTRNLPLNPELSNRMEPILSDLGVTMRVVSGGQPRAGQGPRIGSTRHDDGNAADVDFFAFGRKLSPKKPEDRVILQEIMRRGLAAGITGWGEGDDYMGEGRVHLGFGTPAIWGAGGKSANAPQWMREVFEGSAPTMSAEMQRQIAASASSQERRQGGGSEGAAGHPGQQVQSAIERALTVSHENMSADDNRAILTANSALGRQSNTLVEIGMADETFNTTGPLLAELVERPHVREHAVDTATRIHADMGGEDSGMTISDLTKAMNQVIDRYHVPSDVAGALVKNAVTHTSWGRQWLRGLFGLEGTRRVNHDRADAHFRKFIDPEGNELTRLRPALEQFEQLRFRREGAAQLDQLRQEVEAAQQEHFRAQQRRQDGFNVDTEAPLLRLQALMEQLKLANEELASNPLWTAHSRSRTGN